MKKKHAANNTVSLFLSLAIVIMFNITPLYGADRAPIDVNLIIDGSSSFTESRDEITAWVNNRLDEILADGDRVTIWNAGEAARIIYTGTVNSSSDKDAAKRSVRELQVSSSGSADFAGALRAAAQQTAGRQSSFTYTLLISASPAALSSVINSPQANLLRFSRIEEFSSWRALVVGLNLDARVNRAASSYLNP